MFCIPAEYIDPIKKAITRGEITPDKLVSMTSEQRRLFFSKLMSMETAKAMNLLFEQKLLLKNQERAMYNWGRQITGLSKAEKEATLEKIRQTFANKNNRLYDPKANEQFLNEITSDIYSKKYRTGVSLEEAQTITELTQEMKVAKEKMNSNFTWKNKQDGLEYGATKRALQNYVSDLKLQAIKKGFVNPLKERGVGGKLGAIGGDIKTTINLIAENSRSLVASFDNSFWGRQGLKALSNPRTTRIWAKDFVKSFTDIGKVLKGGYKSGDKVMDAVMSEIYARKNSLNGRYEMGEKLQVGYGEEAYPTSLPSRIPILGRFFRAAEVAYEAGAIRLRADIADKFYDMAEKVGKDMTDKNEVSSINTMTNSMTGRGSMGRMGEGGQASLNKVFFAIKFFKSNFDFLTAHLFDSKVSDFAKKQAAINLCSVLATTVVVLKIAQALDPERNKDAFNPNSSNFGKIRIGNYMTIDLTGGMGSIIVAVDKIITQQYTSATTGVVTKLASGYGTQTGMGVFWEFTEGKFSPFFGVIRDLANQQTYRGGKPTIMGEIKSLTTPISISNISQFQGESGTIKLIGVISDALGLNANVNAPQNDWTQNPTAELQQFKDKVGDAEFKKANDQYNRLVDSNLASLTRSEEYNKLSDDEKQAKVAKLKSDTKNAIFKQYNFKYKKAK